MSYRVTIVNPSPKTKGSKPMAAKKRTKKKATKKAAKKAVKKKVRARALEFNRDMKTLLKRIDDIIKSNRYVTSFSDNEKKVLRDLKKDGLVEKDIFKGSYMLTRKGAGKLNRTHLTRTQRCAKLEGAGYAIPASCKRKGGSQVDPAAAKRAAKKVGKKSVKKASVKGAAAQVTDATKKFLRKIDDIVKGDKYVKSWTAAEKRAVRELVKDGYLEKDVLRGSYMLTSKGAKLIGRKHMTRAKRCSSLDKAGYEIPAACRKKGGQTTPKKKAKKTSAKKKRATKKTVTRGKKGSLAEQAELKMAQLKALVPAAAFRKMVAEIADEPLSVQVAAMDAALKQIGKAAEAKSKPAKKRSKKVAKKRAKKAPKRPKAYPTSGSQVAKGMKGRVPMPKYTVDGAIGQLSKSGGKIGSLRGKKPKERRRLAAKPAYKKAARRMQLAGKGYLMVNPVAEIPGFPGMYAASSPEDGRVYGVAVGKLPKSTRAGGRKNVKGKKGKKVKQMTDKERKKLRAKMMRL